MTDEPNQQSVSKVPEPIRPDGERYKSLEILIEPFIHLSLNELPDAVRKRVDEACFLSSFWDGRPDHRRRLAQEYDIQHDPAMAPENEYWFELTWKIGDCKREIDMWELMQHKSISEAVQKEAKLTELNAKMAGLQLKYSAPYTAPAQTTATPAPVVDGNEPAKQVNAMKKAALIAAFEYEWPSIEDDMREATRNGLKAAAHTGKHGEWDKDKARAWAVSKGKIKQSAPVHPLAGAWPGTTTRNTISD